MKDLAYSMSIVALAVVAAPAVADTGSAPAGSSNSTVAQGTDSAPALEEIVVTATLRSERLLDVPVSVTAFSQEELTQKGIVGLEGIAR